MEKYCPKCNRKFKDMNYKSCPYCTTKLITREGRIQIPQGLRNAVFKRDGYRCVRCGASKDDSNVRLEIDHIVPVAKGGTNDIDNLQTLCHECNFNKGAILEDNDEIEIKENEIATLKNLISKKEEELTKTYDSDEKIDLEFEIKKLEKQLPPIENEIKILINKRAQEEMELLRKEKEKERKDRLFKKLYVKFDDESLHKIFKHFELDYDSDETNLHKLVNNYSEEEIFKYIVDITWDEFEEMNNTTKSIYDLEDNKVLIILKDGTNLTDWEDVEDYNDILYISEDLSEENKLSDQYLGYPNLKAVIVNICGAEDMSYMFSECDSLLTVSSPKPWDLTGITELNGLFSLCPSLVDISVLSGLDLSNITSLDYVFADCTSLTDISPLESWDVSNIKSVEDLFGNCSYLTDITPLSNWNVVNLIKMDLLFNGCSSLMDISPISNWKFVKTESLTGMFLNCESLEDISPLSQFDLSNVKHVGEMFSGCISLTDLSPLSNWDTSNIITMEKMFRYCQSLRDISPLAKWDVSQVRYMKKMFRDCANLKNKSIIDNWNISSEADTYGMFGISDYAVNLSFEEANTTTESIYDLEGHQVLIILADGTNLTSWDDVYWKYKGYKNCIRYNDDILYISEDLSDYTDLSDKYENLKSLKTIIASGVTDKVTSIKNMFSGCESLIDIKSLQEWDVSNVNDMNSLFSQCKSLGDFTSLKKWNVSKVKDMSGMFWDCESLKDLSFLTNWNVSKVESMAMMFADCNFINTTPLLNWNVSCVDNMGSMFSTCKFLKDISALKKWDVSKVTSMEEMFIECESLENFSALKKWDVSNVSYGRDMTWGCKSTNVPPNIERLNKME